MSFNGILYSIENGVLTIQLNRPKMRNALDLEIRRELVDALKQAESDDAVRVIVIRGTGEHFCGGGSVTDMKQRDVFAAREYAEVGIEAIKIIYFMEKPVITAVDGYAVGAGFSIVLASDLVIATERAKFSQKFITVGITPDYASTFFLPRVVGLIRAKELSLTGRIVLAEEAFTMGIISELVQHDEFDRIVHERAKSLAEGPGKAIGLTKRLINSNLENDLQTAFEAELMGTAVSMQSKDHLEAISAFREKRKPEFTGQ